MNSDSSPAGPIFGRSREIDDFARLLGDTAWSSITLVGGDAGIGKTRLLQEIAATCRASGGVVLVGRCLDLGDSAAPYLPISDIARSLRELPAAAELAADFLKPVDGVRPVEFFETVATMFDALAQLAPVLVVLEDVHWADRSTRELLTYLFTHDVRPGVHVVATYRTDDLHRRHPLRPALAEWSRLSTVRRVVLDPLEPGPARDLVRHLQPDLADDAARQIVRERPETLSSLKNSSPHRHRPAIPTSRSSPPISPTSCSCGPMRWTRTPAACCAPPRSPAPARPMPRCAS